VKKNDSGRRGAPSHRLIVLSRKLALRWMEELLRIDEDTPGERWEAAHFLAERPDKWTWSRLVVETENRVDGFVIASSKGDTIHCHRVAVRRDQRSRGVGVELLRAVAEAGDDAGVNLIACKVSRENERAIRWYRRLGFRTTGEDPSNLLLAVPVAELLQNTSSSERTGSGVGT
jgi:ribosomal protein S18 acetylase RimI-like enzyme